MKENGIDILDMSANKIATDENFWDVDLFVNNLYKHFFKIWRCATSDRWNDFKVRNILSINWLDANTNYPTLSDYGAGKMNTVNWVNHLKVGNLVVIADKLKYYGIAVAKTSYQFKGNDVLIAGKYWPSIEVDYIHKLDVPVNHNFIISSKVPPTFYKLDSFSFSEREMFKFIKKSFPEVIDKLNEYMGNDTLDTIPSPLNPRGSNKDNTDISMNTILYGPPGTGKTFHSITHAVSIIQGVSFQSLEEKSATEPGRKQIKDDFDKFVQDGQIVFTTFHQSMGYEDFMEGIKPLPPGKDGKIKYDIVDGIFKDLCSKAEENWLASRVSEENMNSFEDVFENLKEVWEHDKSMKFSMVTPGKEYTLTGFTNKSIPFKKASGGESHSLSINTLRDLYYGKRESTTSGLGIYYPGVVKKLKSFKLPEKGVTPLRKYVIVIDEINRGNVSQIFGEMITLIEKDKRLGEKEALSTVLPYSRDEFGVPPNVYIIGTMNTADRSVEALDTALRRRFAFVHMEPQENRLATDLDGKGINLNALLKTLNNRLRILKDNDHTIGHAWLWNVKNVDGLKKVFADKILPLLQEYFYNDYEKLGLVLGDAFFNTPHKRVAGNEFATFSGSSGLSGQYRNKYLYQLKDANDLELDDFLTLTPAIALHEN